MAISLHNGWTAASLLPSMAAGFSPGASVDSKLAPAQVSGNPKDQKTALDQTAQTRNMLLQKILGQNKAEVPAKQPNQNLSVNSFSSVGSQYPSVLSLNL